MLTLELSLLLKFTVVDTADTWGNVTANGADCPSATLALAGRTMAPAV
jgi:hypothetical protein